METKHTKGEWEVTKDAFNKQQLHFGLSIKTKIGNDIKYIATIEEIGFFTEEENEANAKLIASAPELLEALIEISNCNNRLDYHSDKKLLDFVIELSKNVIKKATQ